MKKGVENRAKFTSKCFQKSIEKSISFFIEKSSGFRSKMEPKGSQNGVTNRGISWKKQALPRGPPRGCQMGAQGLQNGAKMEPKGSQREPKWSPRGAKGSLNDPPRPPRHTPRRPRPAPRRPKGPKLSFGGAKWNPIRPWGPDGANIETPDTTQDAPDS